MQWTKAENGIWRYGVISASNAVKLRLIPVLLKPTVYDLTVTLWLLYHVYN